LGSSELFFRLPSVIAGALLPYVVYRWVADTFDREAGLVAACILSFSPAVVILSAQLRFYTIQMLFMACSLYCLERAFRQKSAAWMRLFGAALLLALWSEYMSVWYTVAIGIYAAIRLLTKEAPRRLKLEWAVTQLAAAAVVIVAYFTHLERLKGNAGELLARDGWLRGSYYHPESQSISGFMRTATGDLFGYLFANPTLGRWMIYVFLIGIGLILLGKAGAWQNRRMAVLALLLPLAVTAAAAMLRVYPYGGSRHDAFLAVFLAPAIAVAFSFAARGKPAVLLLMMACFIPGWLEAEQPHALDDRPQVSKRNQMNRALVYLSQRTPQVHVLVVDQLGSATLGYYLCHGHRDDWRAVAFDANTYRCGDYRILTVEAWGAPLAAYREALLQARKALPDQFPDPAWTFSISFTRDRDQEIVAADFGLFGKIELWRIWPLP
jgi:4-amino-4-deoxy-L-arabinose transferase-like glycosyltransferase